MWLTAIIKNLSAILPASQTNDHKIPLRLNKTKAAEMHSQKWCQHTNAKVTAGTLEQNGAKM